jgi:hypothetical protein
MCVSRVLQVQESMDDWAAGMGAAPQRRDRPQGWRDGQDRYGNQQERTGFARPRGMAAEPYQVRQAHVHLMHAQQLFVFGVASSSM